MTRLFSSIMCCLLMALGTAAAGQQSDLVEVVVEGVGASPEAATKNALEQALMQAVGSFVDTETMVERRSVIKDEVRSLSSTIDTSMREYSQGVVEKFTLLGIENENSIYRATALVVVRSNELAPLFSGFGGAQTTIGGSLFSQFQVEQEQEADRQSFIINDVLAPLYDWSAFDIEIGQPILLREPFKEAVSAKVTDLVGADDQRFVNSVVYPNFRPRPYEGRFGLMLPYTMSLKPEYVQRVTSVLENTADRVGYSAQECPASNDHLSIIFNGSMSFKCYVYENIADAFWRREDVKAVTSAPGIAVQLISANGEIVNETVSQTYFLREGVHTNCGGRTNCISDDLVFHDFHFPMWRDREAVRGWNAKYLPKRGALAVLSKTQGLLVLGMTENLAQNAASISFGAR